METKLWLKRKFSKEFHPAWPCPTCNKGRLEMVKNKFNFQETSTSKDSRGHEEWDPEWIDYVFSGVLECVNPDCKDFIAFGGIGKVEFASYFDNDGNSHRDDYKDIFQPKYFIPALHIFNIHKNCPSSISLEIISAFGLFWNDVSSCANKIRIAVELLMDEQGIQKYPRGKRKERMKLHQRIEMFRQQRPEIADNLMAIKWIGNIGSHVGKIDNVDLLDAFEILEFSLDKLYDDREKRIKKVAKEINKNKGIRKKARRGAKRRRPSQT
jgi:hypothetical protein